MTDNIGQLPQSDALRVAQTDSLGELLSRDPMGFQRLNRDRVVAELRAAREKWEKLEAAGGRGKAAKTKPTVDLSKVKTGDLGL
ncbi:hypothetical protein M0Q28_06050 [Patescibacteria group bacterium]|jgi:hypothetical protein|nr:hypothetical protein [Patescibacteria group bacterium]